jgi:hypothetical protein
VRQLLDLVDRLLGEQGDGADASARLARGRGGEEQ